MANPKVYIYGKHVIEEALLNAPRAVLRVFFGSRDDETKRLRDIAIAENIPVANFDPKTPPKGILPDTSHQGMIGVVSPDKLLMSYADFSEKFTVTADTSIAILGEIQDPQNVGAIIRSAAAFGVSAILIPEHRTAQITGAVVKVSAGMAFRIPLVSISNVNSTVRDLKEKGFWIYGLAGDENGAKSVVHEKFDAPSAFILGNEAKGIREKTLELCDIVLKIPIHPKCESLNVAASAAITFYAWSVKHGDVLK